jgi:hypothetical protein
MKHLNGVKPVIFVQELDAAGMQEHASALQAHMAKEGKRVPASAAPARTLREWQKLFDGQLLQDPITRTAHPIPFDAFAGSDPDTTWLQIGFATVTKVPTGFVQTSTGALVKRLDSKPRLDAARQT